MDMTSAPPTVLSEPLAAAYLGLSRAFLRKRRRLGLVPAYCKIGKRILYQRTDLDALIAATRIDPGRPRR
jgi:hypothetical protein